MNNDPGIKMTCTCGACPEQYEGTVDGNPAYFRLRHSCWRFVIVKPGMDPHRPVDEGAILYYKDGEYRPGEDAGVMEGAERFIAAMVAEFRQSIKP